MTTLIEKSNVNVEGHVVILDADTREVLLDKYNAINFQNVALAVARLLANQTTDGKGHFIASLAFGNGGTVIDANGNIEYKSAKVDGSTGSLYSPSPDGSGGNYTKEITSFEIVDATNQPYTDLVCHVVLGYDEPADALDLDNATDFEDPASYVFDEIALVTDYGDFLTHLIFHPIQKSKNRKLEIFYTLRIRAGV